MSESVLSIVLAAFTAVGAIAATSQAISARRARHDAQTAERQADDAAARAALASERAAAAAEKSASYQERSASTLEKQAVLQRLSARPPDPWIFTTEDSPSGDQKWLATNNMQSTVLWATITTPNGSGERWIVPDDDVVENVGRNESLGFTFMRRLSSPGHAVVWVVWDPADGTAQQTFAHTVR